MYPPKLKKGDWIRVISPSRSLAIVSQDVRAIAKKRLEALGFKVTFSKHSEEKDSFSSSSINSRLEDIHEAFSDKSVSCIMTSIGGFNSNQLLSHLDYGLIKENPKVLCGYSDITALHNSIFKKAGLVTYHGPHFSTFGMLKGIDYTLEFFGKCLTDQEPVEVRPSAEWSDDAWYKDQDNRAFIKNNGFLAVNEGEAAGRIIGGNLGTFRLLQGTGFMPSFKNSILFLEDCEPSKAWDFDRELQSIAHLPGFKQVKALVIGRFQKASEISRGQIVRIIKSKKELDRIPVIVDVDFGHTSPMITFPIGGEAKILAGKGSIKIELTEH